MSDKSTISSYVTWSYPGHPAAYISELFAVVERAKNDELRKKLIKDWIMANSNSQMKVKALRIAFECMFLPNCKMDMPVGKPTNIQKGPSMPERSSGSLFRALGSIGYFLPQSEMFIKDALKRERAFVQLAESMHVAEMETYVAIKDADLKFIPGLTHSLVSSVVPGWIPTPIALTSTVVEDSAQEKKEEKRVSSSTSSIQAASPKLNKDGSVRKKPGKKPTAKN